MSAKKPMANAKSAFAFLATGIALLAGVTVLLTRAAADLEGQFFASVGLVRSIHPNTDFQDPPLSRGPSTVVDLSFLDENPSLPKRSYSVRWEGFWDLRRDGPIDFYTRADDHLEVFLDGERVVVRDFADGPRTLSNRLQLSRGVHRLRLDFVQRGGGARLNVQWGRPGEPRRSLDPQALFLEEPSSVLLQAARRAETLRAAAGGTWMAFRVLLGVGLTALSVFAWSRLDAGARIQRTAHGVRALAERYSWAGSVALLAAGGAVMLSAVLVRLPGWDPQSLWYDDLVWAAIARAETIGQVLSVPATAPPGFFVVLRGMRALFGDPEWSLQIVPFAAGIAAIPLMAFLVWRITGSRGIALFAASLTALNPRLAHYTVFVKPYSLDFITTALLLLSGLLLIDHPRVSVSRFARLALLSVVALFVSATSVMTSGPLMNLAALRALLARRREALGVVVVAALYDLVLVLAFLLMRARPNKLVREDFQRHFISFTSLGDAWTFLKTMGLRQLQAGLPSWRDAEPWNPELLPWLVPFVGLGLIWLLARRSTRPIGWVAIAFWASFLTLSVMQMYPLGPSRAGIFAYPVVIALCAAGVHLITEWLPWREGLRGAIGLAAAIFALSFPIRVQYWNVDDARLVRHVVRDSSPSDGLVLSPAATFLAAVYGPWPVTISASTAISNGTDARVARELTLYLPPQGRLAPVVDQFLAESRPARIWYVAFRTHDGSVLTALSDQGYKLTEVERSSIGRLFLGVAETGDPR